MTTSGRRHSDLIAQRKGNAILMLAIALSLLATYTSYHAIKKMNELADFGANCYRLGREIGSQPDYRPSTSEGL